MRASFVTQTRCALEKIRRRLLQVGFGCAQSVQPERIDGGTHYFSTHGCKLGFEVGSLSFPDFFLVGALAWKKLAAMSNARGETRLMRMSRQVFIWINTLRDAFVAENSALALSARDLHPSPDNPKPRVCTEDDRTTVSYRSVFRFHIPRRVDLCSVVDKARGPPPLTGEHAQFFDRVDLTRLPS